MPKISNLRILIAGDAASAERMFARLKKEAESAASGSANSFNKSTSKIGGAFNRLGASMQSWGLPFGKTVSDIGTKLDSAKGKGAKFSGVMSDIGKVGLQSAGAGLAGVAYESIKLGMGFQTAMTQLVTGAGEAQGSIGMVSQGVLNMAGAVGQTPTALAQALYTIESAGYHGAAGLAVLKASAEGATTGNASLGTVADATTTIMNAYGKSAGNSAQIVDQLIATEKSGKSHLQDIAGALSAVIPIAANAGLSYAQVGGAMATMTGMGMSAQQSTQDLANTIRSLQNPNAVAVTEMQQLGINSNKVAKNLGKNGLTGTLGYLSTTILKNMGPSGEVMLKAFNQSKAAAGDLKIMLGSMSPKMRGLANEFTSGKLTMSQWRKQLPTNMQGVIGQFSALYAKSNGFNQQLKAGLPATQTYEAALSKVTGGATGLNTSLMLTGPHAATFAANVAAIGTASHQSGSKVTGFNLVQKTLAFQVSQAKDSLLAMGTKLGLVLIPWVEKGIKAVSAIVGWFSKNKVVAEALGAVFGGVLALAVGFYVAGIVKAGIKTVQNFVKMSVGAAKWATQMMTSSGRAKLAQERQAKEAERTAARAKDSAAKQVESNDSVTTSNETTATTAQTTATERTVANDEIATSTETLAATTETEGAAMDVALEGTATTAEATGVAVDAAMGPVGLAIAAVGIVIAVFGSHWKAIWSGIQSVLHVAWKFIQQHFGFILTVAFGPLGLAISVLVKNWKGAWKGITGALKSAWDFMKPIFDAIGKAASAVGNFISGIFGGGGGKPKPSSGIAAHNIPHMAAGGLVTKPTLAIVGEAGPEMVVPLTRAGSVSLTQPPGLPRSMSAGGAAGAAGSSGLNQTINYSPNVVISGTTQQIGAHVQTMLDQHSRDLAERIGAHA